MILQWTTWEREEWLHEDTWYQVNASGIDWVPTELQDRYKRFIIGVDWTEKTRACHDKIWQFHCELERAQIRHLFFSGHSTFSEIQNHQNWGTSYICPYSQQDSYHNWLKNNGGAYANPQSYHFDAESHRLWAKHVLQYINDNNLIAPNEIPTD